MLRVDTKTSTAHLSDYGIEEHLRTAAEVTAYLGASLGDAPDDAAGIAKALGDVARTEDMDQATWDPTRMNSESLGRVLSAHGDPNFIAATEVAETLGVSPFGPPRHIASRGQAGYQALLAPGKAGGTAQRKRFFRRCAGSASSQQVSALIPKAAI